MSKKDFIALADAIRNHNRKGDQVDPFTVNQIEALAAFCKSQNHAFMPKRWADYIEGKCGPGGKVLK